MKTCSSTVDAGLNGIALGDEDIQIVVGDEHGVSEMAQQIEALTGHITLADDEKFEYAVGRWNADASSYFEFKRESSPFLVGNLRGSWVDHAASSTDSSPFPSSFRSRWRAARRVGRYA
jgi:hypothetical protein